MAGKAYAPHSRGWGEAGAWLAVPKCVCLKLEWKDMAPCDMMIFKLSSVVEPLLPKAS